MQATTLNLDIMPTSLRLDLSIGNLVARDKSFGEWFPYSTLCDFREGGTSSLIEITYTTHKVQGAPNNAAYVSATKTSLSAAKPSFHFTESPLFQGGPDPAEGGRVPAHLDYQKLKGKLNALDIVFLNRQIQEIMAYASGLLALQPVSLLVDNNL